MTDQDQDKDPEPGKLGAKLGDDLGGTPGEEPADVEGHGSRKARVVQDDDDDVAGHFSTIRSTGNKGE